jgi:hypothetical protein
MGRASRGYKAVELLESMSVWSIAVGKLGHVMDGACTYIQGRLSMKGQNFLRLGSVYQYTFVCNHAGT